MKTTKILNRRMLLIICSILIYGASTHAQSLKIDSKSFSMSILGTTNVHDFESKVTQVSGEIVLGENKQVQSMFITIPVKSIKSKEKVMDSKTYEAFNSDKNPTISFKLLDVTSLKITGEDINVVLTGNLTMAGVTRKVNLISSGRTLKSGAYEFKGSVALKMTDFKMKPPTAMMGMMKVGDGITLKYQARFESGQLTQN